MAGTKQSEAPGSELLRAIKNAGAEEKAAIDTQIEELQKELDALKQASKLLQIKLNGKPVRTATGKTRGAVTESRREKVHDYLKDSGPAISSVIATACGIPTGSITAVLNHEWFTKTPHGYRIARRLDGQQ